MPTHDLPESKMVADRRGKKSPQTLREMAEQAASEPQPDMSPPDSSSDVAKRLGVDQIGKTEV